MGRSRPRWGWHRLSPEAARQLVAAAGITPGTLVLDVGAGEGAITAALIDAGARVIAIELHRGRFQTLRDRFGDEARVVRADARDLRLPRRAFCVVANPPFAATSPLLRRLLAPGSRLVSADLVLQRQATDRWLRPDAPGVRRWGRAFSVQGGPPVPRRAFRPAPPVDARILRIRRR